MAVAAEEIFGASSLDDPCDLASTAQVDLPKVPVPDLNTTMQRYVATLEPIVTSSQLEYTKGLIQSFCAPDGPGPRIQQELFKRQQNMDNWAYDWCLPINVCSGMVFIPCVRLVDKRYVLPYTALSTHQRLPRDGVHPRVFKNNTDIARFAARLVYLAAKHKDKLDRKALPIERATTREKGQPLCMSQYYRIFNSYRVPGLQNDRLLTTDSTTEHIIVACSNQLYVLYVKKREDRLTEEELASQFMYILNNTISHTGCPPVGILTSQRRDHWAESRALLMKDEQNQRNLELIENCMLLICLDQKPLPSKFNRKAGPRGGDGLRVDHRDETNMAHQMLHGGGSSYNSPNRWFDKTVQLIIGTDGVNGLCYEHSPCEGIAVIQLMEEFLENCKDLTPGSFAVLPSNTALQPLHWNMTTSLHAHIRDAGESLDNLIEDLDFYVFRYNGYGKDFIKSCRISPDVYTQLALQLAYHKLYGRLTATYESASTRRFLLGRVDCIRSATTEALQWAAAMNQTEADDGNSADPLQPSKRVTFSLFTDAEKLAFLDSAVKRQTEIMVENIHGQGLDIHLLGLREQGKEMGLHLELFEDEAYKISNHFALSTSQVSTQSESFMGYGPVVPDGYGASYNFRSSSIIFCISAFHSCEFTKAARFAQSLEDSLNAMQILLQQRLK